MKFVILFIVINHNQYIVTVDVVVIIIITTIANVSSRSGGRPPKLSDENRQKQQQKLWLQSASYGCINKRWKQRTILRFRTQIHKIRFQHFTCYASHSHDTSLIVS